MQLYVESMQKLKQIQWHNLSDLLAVLSLYYRLAGVA